MSKRNIFTLAAFVVPIAIYGIAQLSPDLALAVGIGAFLAVAMYSCPAWYL